MDKFHKYCLSVLLVIVCSNVSGQINHESIKSEAYKEFYEIYSQFFSDQCEVSQEICLIEKSIRKFAINHKQNATDSIGDSICRKFHKLSYNKKLKINFSEEYKHSKALENFEKQSKLNDFAENIYFKSKVAKIRNKDYLDLKRMALQSYD